MSRWSVIGLLVLSAAFAFPFYWAALASLTPEARLFAGPVLLPHELVLDNYRALFSARAFVLPLRNSLIVSGSATLVCLLVGTPCAYALSRLEFAGRTWALGFVLAVSVFPQIAVVAPLYLLLRSLHLIDTYAGLVLPYVAFAMPLTVWLLVGFFRQIPRELEDAALIDGASRLQVLRHVMLPLAAPGLAATGILSFVSCWNELLFALSFTVGPGHQTVPVAIALLRGEHQVPLGLMLAAAVVATAPVAVLVLIGQRPIVRGLTAGALKE